MGRIPALILAGGKLSNFGGMKAVKEFRVWVHPTSGDDYYYAYKTLAGAVRKHRSMKARSESPLAVVRDKNYRKYREVMIDRESLIVAGYKFRGGKLIIK